MKKYIKNNGFTLIEIIVSVTILSIIMISVFMIFIKSSEVNRKIEVGRLMQENFKNIVEIISEDVRVNGIPVGSGIGENFISLGEKYSSGSIFYTGINSYYLAIKTHHGRVQKNNTFCSDFKNNCFLIKRNLGIPSPITNSWVQATDLMFYVSNDFERKVTINLTLQPSVKKGLQSKIIKDNKIIFQTTLSERLYKDY